MLFAILALLALLSGALMSWQWLAGLLFPLGRRLPLPDGPWPKVSVLKPVRGADPGTVEALATWLFQDYPGEWEVIFGVDSADDPAVPLLKALLARYPDRGHRARWQLCPESLGMNRKVSNLIQMARGTSGEFVVVSDADVAAEPDLLAQMIVRFSRPEIGLVHCLYRCADAPTPATRWEAFVVNADFWSQVLQNQTFRALDYALGAAMAVRRTDLAACGGFEALADHLADDNRLGRLIVRAGKRTELCHLPVDCRVGPATWGEVWAHQLRWAVTIRVCQPIPYFLSILANGTLWPLLWMILAPGPISATAGTGLLLHRCLQGLLLEAQFTGRRPEWTQPWIVPRKDLFQVVLWASAFLQRHVVWRGNRFRVRSDGRLKAETGTP